MSPAVGAELIADSGAAATGDEFFRSPEFLAAEEVGHSLVIGGREPSLALPLIVREVPGAGGMLDATSPYGYPGVAVEPGSEPLGPAEVDWSATDLVSVFVRDAVAGPTGFTGARERSALQIHDPAQPRSLRPRLAEQIRANARAGWSVETTAGSETSAAQRSAFAVAYAETMQRVGAPERYLFAQGYFDRVLRFERSWLLLARSPDGAQSAGAIAAVSDGHLHYYLGGTADAAIEASPFKNVVESMIELAGELALPLNLGGGVEPRDGLERFKRGFANSTAPFRTHEIVCDEAAYARLAGGREAGGFFPAYRA